MDPMVAEIVAGVLWFFLGSLGTVVVYFATAFAVGALGSFTAKANALAVLIGWVFTVIWEAFVLIQVIIHAVNLIQLLT